MANKAPAPFGRVHALEPKIKHSHTGTSSMPSWRWVFTTSRELWGPVFAEHVLASFEAHSLTDNTARQDAQMEGVGDSVKYLQGLVDSEMNKLAGPAAHVVLGGISPSGAVGL